VFFQFDFEASVLAAIGAVSGLWIGRVASAVIAARANLPFVFERTPAMMALATALFLNLLFSAWPAFRAARLDPIKALNYE
jgi:putative ABC transport system permease protein